MHLVTASLLLTTVIALESERIGVSTRLVLFSLNLPLMINLPVRLPSAHFITYI